MNMCNIVSILIVFEEIYNFSVQYFHISFQHGVKFSACSQSYSYPVQRNNECFNVNRILKIEMMLMKMNHL